MVYVVFIFGPGTHAKTPKEHVTLIRMRTLCTFNLLVLPLFFLLSIFWGDLTHTFLSYMSYFAYYMIKRIQFWYKNNLVLIPCWHSFHTCENPSCDLFLASLNWMEIQAAFNSVFIFSFFIYFFVHNLPIKKQNKKPIAECYVRLKLYDFYLVLHFHNFKKKCVHYQLVNLIWYQIQLGG